MFALTWSRQTFLRSLIAMLVMAFAGMQATAQTPAPTAKDAADEAAGEYRGAVTSDTGAAPKQNVKMTVTKAGPNKVKVTSNYDRLPPFEVSLKKADNMIYQSEPTYGFQLDIAKTPNALQVNVDGASWTGARYKPDLADMAEGEYYGDVISDARGSSKSDVAITVTRIGPNRVSITSDYARLPKFEANLTRAMDTIQKTGKGDEVFLLDLSKKPLGLDITVAEASWMGARQD